MEGRVTECGLNQYNNYVDTNGVLHLNAAVFHDTTKTELADSNAACALGKIAEHGVSLLNAPVAEAAAMQVDEKRSIRSRILGRPDMNGDSTSREPHEARRARDLPGMNGVGGLDGTLAHGHDIVHGDIDARRRELGKRRSEDARVERMGPVIIGKRPQLHGETVVVDHVGFRGYGIDEGAIVGAGHGDPFSHGCWNPV